jgi:NhaC family Na+:H+ antiporter
MSAVKQPSLLQAFIPVAFLCVLLFVSALVLFKDDSSAGANQIALLLAAGVAALVGIYNGLRWRDIEQGIVHSISMATGAMLILLAVGALVGTWILSGTVPTMIYYGLQLLDPSIFYFVSCLVCSIVSISIGSSWTTAGTIGVGLMGTALGLGLSPAITAGAIVSGAYFGDKLSPLSDTTNLAPAVTGTDLFAHIQHMLWTTIPSWIAALLIFLLIGFNQADVSDSNHMAGMLLELSNNFSIAWYLLLPLFLVLGMAYKRLPAFPTIMIGALVGGVFAAVFQRELIIDFVANAELSSPVAVLSGVWTALFGGYVATTGHPELDDLLSRGGMSSMLNTIWLIICAMTFGGVMEKTGLLQRIVTAMLGLAKNTGSLIATTVVTCISANILAGDQYIAIILPGRMFKLEFQRRGLDPKNLSRAIEDSATITSPLVPWNTCGAFMSATLGVATGDYFLFCFFNLITPLISIAYGYTGFKITPLLKPLEGSEEQPQGV